MLSTFHRQHDYKNGDKARIAKFMPRFDGSFMMTASNPELSSYTLNIPNSPTKFNTFHVSELRPFIPNDSDLFPSRDHPCPGPILTKDGLEEHFIDRIIDHCRRGRGCQYLVCWVSYGAEDDCWLPR